MDEPLVRSTPPPPPSSITPPPSSQAVAKALVPTNEGLGSMDQLIVARTPTPPVVPSSPPPTFKSTAPTQIIRKILAVPASSEISNASSIDVAGQLQAKIEELEQVKAQLQDARTSAAHYKLQHNLLSMEAAETANRMEAEHEMTKREVEVLRHGDHHPSRTSNNNKEGGAIQELLSSDLTRRAATLHLENESLRKRLDRAIRIIAHQERQLDSAFDMNLQLKIRIKENREHFNRSRVFGSALEFQTPRQPNTMPNTPRRDGSRYTSSGKLGSRNQNAGKDTISALLLADQVLHQEQESTSPHKSRGFKSSMSCHTRGTHSLSSLPLLTPLSQPSSGSNTGLLPPVSLETSHDGNIPSSYKPSHRMRRRRESRDSTISASESETNSRQNEESDDDEIPESQASQLATSMLRYTKGAKIPPMTPEAQQSGTMIQTKILGSVTKGFAENDIQSKKRKQPSFDELDSIQEMKRARASEGVGLGIGWGGARS